VNVSPTDLIAILAVTAVLGVVGGLIA